MIPKQKQGCFGITEKPRKKTLGFNRDSIKNRIHLLGDFKRFRVLGFGDFTGFYGILNVFLSYLQLCPPPPPLITLSFLKCRKYLVWFFSYCSGSIIVSLIFVPDLTLLYRWYFQCLRWAYIWVFWLKQFQMLEEFTNRK